VIGSAASVSAGESIEAQGAGVNDREHGLQFRADQLRVVPPTTLEGIEKYLGSGMVKGIGPHFARKLVRAFGEAVFDVIETMPERLVATRRTSKPTMNWQPQGAEARDPSDVAVDPTPDDPLLVLTE
jgi:exodeoxyribonuclease V alpha subunit